MKKYFLLSFLCITLPLWAKISGETGFIESSDQVKIYYERAGAGEPLFLIAGGPGDSHAYFKSYFDGVEKKFTVIYYDARGRGLSGRAADIKLYSIEKDVEDLEELRTKLGYDRISVFGHSYGGLVAESYAIKYPEHLNHLILCNTFHGAAGWQNNIDNCNRNIQESFPDVWKHLMELKSKMRSNAHEWRQAYDPCIENMYWYDVGKMKKHQKHFEGIRTPYDSFADTVYYSIIGDDPDVEVNGTMKGRDLRENLKKLSVPTLVLSGRADKIATTRQAMEIQELIPNSKLFIFDHSGHLPFVEQNKKFTKVLSKFLTNEKDSE